MINECQTKAFFDINWFGNETCTVVEARNLLLCESVRENINRFVVQVSIHESITFLHSIGKGTYGEVFAAERTTNQE